MTEEESAEEEKSIQKVVNPTTEEVGSGEVREGYGCKSISPFSKR